MGMQKFVLRREFVSCNASTPKPCRSLIVELARHSRRRPFQINSLNPRSNISSFPHKAHKVLPRSLALMSQFAGFFLFHLQLLDIALQADAEIIGRIFECTPDFGGNAGAVGVDVVD